ncbi:putative sulfate exporter family transporter [Ferruginibacter sp. HRS2-29]|uniref:YeiH family protein n=1 Tax=Ferruginibacter sp. HRS2-29 TaxID=2487334 RepID=UPI0020CC66AB
MFKNFRVRNITSQQLIFIVLVVLCLTPWITPPMALLLGLMVAQFIGHPFLHLNQKATSRLLQFSVIGLGFGMNVKSALQAGKEGFLFAVASILGTLILGYFLGKLLKVEQKTSLLISSGTAICGGSAIAALSPILEAEENQISVALGTIFILNAVALFIFPVIGHALNLTEHQFGLWCAIAIHDTSSVVGAAGKYGPQALETATTVKLSRALWIIPIAIGASILLKNDAKKIKIPYFIGLFILAMLLNSYVPAITKISFYITGIAKTGLTLTLFLIGAGLSRKVLTSVGLKPLLQGILLWLVISSGALYAIRSFAG